MAVYKGGEIASAKPSIQEQCGVKHFGFDLVDLDQNFNAALFFNEYKIADDYSKKHQIPLIIVGGTSFYLKALTGGLSEIEPISNEIKEKALDFVTNDLNSAIKLLNEIDPDWQHFDSYRVTRAFELYFAFNDKPSNILASSKKEPLCTDLPIFEIEVDREILRQRIKLRTRKMFEMGLIDEVGSIAKNYNNEIKYLKAIGPKEILSYLRNEINMTQAEELINIHTSQLAKRQRTFNKTQFGEHYLQEFTVLKDIIKKLSKA